jgi:hypothetical protein
MGYLLKPECSCGNPFKEIFMGGGKNNFETSCEIPFYCRECEKIKIRNLFKKRPLCKNCQWELENLGSIEGKINCDECEKLTQTEPLNDKFKCGRCRKELKMYGEVIGYFSDKNLDLEYMKEIQENCFEWSFLLDMTYYLPNQNNYCPKCKTNNLQFTPCGVWD